MENDSRVLSVLDILNGLRGAPLILSLVKPQPMRSLVI